MHLLSVTDLTKKITGLYRDHFPIFLRILLWLLVPATLSSVTPILPISELNKNILEVTLSVISVILSLWLSVVIIDLIVNLKNKNTEGKITTFNWDTACRMIDLVIISILQGIVVGLGFLLFIIPGFIFWIWFSFARYAVLIDGKSPGTESLQVSKKLVDGKFWQITWRWFGSYLYFGSFFALGLVVLLAAIGALAGDPKIAFDFGRSIWWADLIISVSAVLVTPIFTAIGVYLYEEAKKNS